MSTSAWSFFLLAFPALFSIINPIGGAFIFLSATQSLQAAERRLLARWVAIHSFMIVIASFFVGGYVLKLFGISMPVLRVAGGTVLALSAWRMLSATDGESHASPVRLDSPASASRVAFYPLTMPITTGPGTISVAIALGTSRPRAEEAILDGYLDFLVGAVMTTVLISLSIYLAYRHAERIARVIGPTGTTIIVRLASFLLFCIGFQVIWNGLSELLRSI